MSQQESLNLNKVVVLSDQWRGVTLCNKGVLHDQHPVSDSRNRLVGTRRFKLSGKTVTVQTLLVANVQNEDYGLKFSISTTLKKKLF